MILLLFAMFVAGFLEEIWPPQTRHFDVPMRRYRPDKLNYGSKLQQAELFLDLPVLLHTRSICLPTVWCIQVKKGIVFL